MACAAAVAAAAAVFHIVWRARRQWLDELLEAVREHVCRGCAKLPALHGLTVGMDWFHEASSLNAACAN